MASISRLACAAAARRMQMMATAILVLSAVATRHAMPTRMAKLPTATRRMRSFVVGAMKGSRTQRSAVPQKGQR
jgi:hypothetical protein